MTIDYLKKPVRIIMASFYCFIILITFVYHLTDAYDTRFFI